jgi:hypothetical protein
MCRDRSITLGTTSIVRFFTIVLVRGAKRESILLRSDSQLYPIADDVQTQQLIFRNTQRGLRSGCINRCA